MANFNKSTKVGKNGLSIMTDEKQIEAVCKDIKQQVDAVVKSTPKK